MDNVVLINPFEVADGQDDEFVRWWDVVTDYLRTRPGFVRTRLHRALGPDARYRFVNVAEWTSPRDFQAAITSDGFRKLAEGAPSSYPSPARGRPDRVTGHLH
jgi:heme oxygenase (mycobilin-producing)